VYVLAAAACLAVVLAAPTAHAQQALRLQVDWDKLGAVLRDGPGAILMPREALRPDPPLFGTSPQMSVVARDWSASQSLYGALGPTDQLRLSSSLRMVVARVRLGEGRITPFAQVGFGQWRVDTSVVQMPNDVEVAGQIGGGFELRIAPRVVVALEGSCTMLYRESVQPEMLASPRLWGALLAGRAHF
jgi:hypothetical protein